MINVINNDFHPVDQGLEATNDHWGDVVLSANEPMGRSGHQMRTEKPLSKLKEMSLDKKLDNRDYE